MNDNDPAYMILGWLAFALVLCVVALMVTGTIYGIHRIIGAW